MKDAKKQKKKIVAIIPARGGSKGLRRKNIHPIAGKPLISYTILAAKNSKLIDTVYVETEDEEIAGIAKEYGAEIIPQPAHLAEDHVTSDEALRFAIEHLCGSDASPDVVVYLQSTDIMRKKDIIDQVIQALLDNPRHDAAFAVSPTHKNYWRIEDSTAKKLTDIKNLPRQHKEPLHREDTGIACAAYPDTIMTKGRVGSDPILVTHDIHFSHIDIHTDHDAWMAEQVILKYKDSGDYAF